MVNVMALDTIKHLVPIVVHCLLQKQSLCFSLSESKRYMTNSNIDIFANELSDKIVSVGKKFFDENTLVNMVLPLDTDEYMFALMGKTSQKINSFWTVLAYDVAPKSKLDFMNPIAIWRRPTVYLVPLYQPGDFYRFAAQLEKLKKHPNFNSRADFVFLSITNDCEQYNNPSIWLSFFSKLWKHDCLIAVVLILSKCDFQLTIVMAEPFSAENPCRSPSIQGIRFISFIPKNENHHFIRQSRRYFNRCRFLVATSPYPPYTIAKQIQKSNNTTKLDYVGGLEIKLVHLLSEKLGFTYDIDQSQDYTDVGCLNQHANSTEVGVAKDKIEFCFGGRAPDFQSAFKYEIPFTYMFSSLSWYVADASVISQWEIVFNAFSLHVWCLLLFANLAFGVLFNKLEEFERGGNKLLSKFKLQRNKNYLELLRTFLGMPSTLKPKAFHLRTLYFAWNLFSMIINIVFSTSLFELLRNPPFGKEIRTIQDLHDSGLEVAGKDIYFDMFSDAKLDNITRSVLNKRKECLGMEQCYEKLFRDRDFSIMDRQEHVRFLVDLKKMKLHKIDQDMITLGVSILINRGSPVATYMGKVIIHAFEVGLITHWQKETNWRFGHKYSNEVPLEESDSKLSVHNLQTAFCLLIFGYSASLFVFLVEIFYCSFEKKLKYLFNNFLTSDSY